MKKFLSTTIAFLFVSTNSVLALEILGSGTVYADEFAPHQGSITEFGANVDGTGYPDGSKTVIASLRGKGWNYQAKLGVYPIYFGEDAYDGSWESGFKVIIDCSEAMSRSKMTCRELMENYEWQVDWIVAPQNR